MPGPESEVVDREEMHAALISMGFYPTVRIVKARRTGSMDGLLLCLDEVEQAGVFLEVEQLVPCGESGEAAQQQLDRSSGRSVCLSSGSPTPTTR